MYLTIHPLERVPLAPAGPGWADDLLTTLGPAATAAWAGAQYGASRGALVALWPDEMTAASAAEVETGAAGQVLLRAGRVLRLTEVHHGPAADRLPSSLQLTWFEGPRSTEQFDADQRSGRRIERTIAGLSGYAGVLVGHAPDRAYAVVVFTDGPGTLTEGRDLIMSSPLDPDEDPALLSGPDTIEVCAIARATTPLAGLAPVRPEGDLR